MVETPSYEELEEKLASLTGENLVLSMKLKAVETIPLSRNFEESARHIYDICKAIIGATCGYVALLTEDGLQNEVLFLDDGGFPCDVDPDLPMPIRGLRAVAYETGAVEYENDFSTCEWVRFMPSGHLQLQNVLFAPLNFGGKTVGVMGLANKPAGFSEYDKDVAKSFGDIAALALKHARSLEMLEEIDKFSVNLLAKSPNPILVINPDRSVRFVNQAFEKLTGFTANEIIGLKDPYPWWPDEAIHDTRADFDKAVVHGAEKVEELFKKKTGEAFSVEITSKPVRKGKKLAYYLANWVDISDRKRAEATLRESESKYWTMMEAIKDPVYICSEDYRVQYMNQAMVERIGRDGTGEFCYQALHDFHEKCPWCKIEEVYGEGHGTKDIVSPKDNRSFSISSAILSNEDGSTSKISVFRDTTDFKMLQEQLQQAQKMETIGNIAGGIAHDFNNILFPIVGLSELLLEVLPPDSVEHRNVQQILKAGERGSGLVQQILAFSRKSEHKMMPVRVQRIIKEVLKLSRSTIPSNIEMSQFIQGECGFVMADTTQLHQVAMNLITNAYHAVEQGGGKISISLKEIAFSHENPAHLSLKSGRYVMLSVSDTGHGIDPSVMDKIFDPYFTTKDRKKGTGLGLAVVFGIVKEHGGEIRAYSELGKGATFNVYLPLLEESLQTVSGVEAQVAPGGTERILLVDDDDIILRVEKMMLKRLGYQVESRNSSIGALGTFGANPESFDLVITDMAMPKMTGDQFVEQLLSIRPDIPIILLTGFSERMNEEKAERIGAKGFLLKPVRKSNLAMLVRRLLDQAKGGC